MTKEEAIKVLESMKSEESYNALIDLCNMAIESLSANYTTEKPNDVVEQKNDVVAEPTDLISRADAIKAVHKYFMDLFNDEPHETDEDGDEVFTDMKSVNTLLNHNKAVSKAINSLPSADRPSGEWIFKDNDGGFAGEYHCGNCGKRAEVDLYGEWILSNYCPNCGAYMKGGTE